MRQARNDRLPAGRAIVLGLRRGGAELGRISPRVPARVLRELAAVRRVDRRRPDPGARCPHEPARPGGGSAESWAPRSPPSRLRRDRAGRGDRRARPAERRAGDEGLCHPRIHLPRVRARRAAHRDPGPDRLARPPRGHHRDVRTARAAGARPDHRRPGPGAGARRRGGTRTHRRASRSSTCPSPWREPAAAERGDHRDPPARGGVPGGVAGGPDGAPAPRAGCGRRGRRPTHPAGRRVHRRVPRGRAARRAGRPRPHRLLAQLHRPDRVHGRRRAAGRAGRRGGLRRRRRVRARDPRRGARRRDLGDRRGPRPRRARARTS